MLVPTLFTFAMLVATVSISDVPSFRSSATVVIFAMFVAVVFILAMLAPTVFTELLPDPVLTAVVIRPKSSVNVICPATILMLV